MADFLHTRKRVWESAPLYFFGQPQAPNPTATSNTQAQYNLGAATSQQELNNVNQTTPYGSLTYSQTGTNPDGTPIFSANQTLTPQISALLNTGIGTQTEMAGDANTLASNLGSSLTQAPNLDPSQITNTAMANEQRYMQPFFTQQNSNLESQLQNQGIEPGSQAYNNSLQQLQENQGNTMASTYSTIEPQAYQQALSTYQAPINTLGTLLGESQAPTVNSSLVSTPQASVAAPNYQQQVNQNYQNQVASSNNMMSGLFSIPSTLLGGWAKGGFATSDIRVKENLHRVGSLPNGLGVYAFNFKGSHLPQIGLIAQEVEKIHPEAVQEFDGVKHVNYALAVI